MLYPCYLDNMKSNSVIYLMCFTSRLRYDANTNSYHNNTEVKIHVPGFGGTSSIEYLIPGLSKSIEYFHGMVEYFVDRDYKRGNTIRGAPYDWRLAAGEKSNIASVIRRKLNVIN